MKVFSGNLGKHQKENPDQKGWFIGHFLEKGSNFFSEEFEVKWYHHPKGDIKNPPGRNKLAKTITILIKGKFMVRYPEENTTEVLLSKQGDYVFHDAGVLHISEALEDSVMLTIRWPSISGDQISV